jgi:hypothetical protein
MHHNSVEATSQALHKAVHDEGINLVELNLQFPVDLVEHVEDITVLLSLS